MAQASLKPAITAANEYDPWKKVGTALGEMNLQDVKGKTWTLADLRGKTTFVTAWATWCSPCRDELPSLQKLFDLTKNRTDIQVITLNFDEDPGLVEPFLSAYHYTFPVLMSGNAYGVKSSNESRIPQNSIVDGEANLREKSLGFDERIANWAMTMFERLK